MSGIQCLDGCGNIRIRTEEVFLTLQKWSVKIRI